MVDISVPAGRNPDRPGIRIHRRGAFETRTCDLIPVTDPVCTLVDLAATLSADQLENAVNEADKLDLVDPEALRPALERLSRRPGIAPLRRLLDRATFTLTDSELERRFLRIVRSAGLPLPEAGETLNGFRVDFHWPDLGLVVETDGLRYHRTPAQQGRDHLRDQIQAAAGLRTLRFTHAQVAHDPDHVASMLISVAHRSAEEFQHP